MGNGVCATQEFMDDFMLKTGGPYSRINCEIISLAVVPDVCSVLKYFGVKSGKLPDKHVNVLIFCKNLLLSTSKYCLKGVRADLCVLGQS